MMPIHPYPHGVKPRVTITTMSPPCHPNVIAMSPPRHHHVPVMSSFINPVRGTMFAAGCGLWQCMHRFLRYRVPWRRRGGGSALVTWHQGLWRKTRKDQFNKYIYSTKPCKRWKTTQHVCVYCIYSWVCIFILMKLCMQCHCPTLHMALKAACVTRPQQFPQWIQWVQVPVGCRQQYSGTLRGCERLAKAEGAPPELGAGSVGQTAVECWHRTSWLYQHICKLSIVEYCMPQ